MTDMSASDLPGSSSDDTSAAPSANERTTGDGISRRILLNGAAAAGGAMMAAAMVPSGAALAQTTTQLGSGVSPTRFVLSVGESTIATFDTLLGITNETTGAAQYVSSTGTGPSVQQLFGVVKPAVVVLRRPASSALELWKWYEQVSLGQPTARRNASLSLMDGSGNTVAKFSLPNAYPTKLELTTDQGVLEEMATFLSDHATRTA